MNGSIWTKSKFLGLSLGVNFIGSGRWSLSLPSHCPTHLTVPSSPPISLPLPPISSHSLSVKLHLLDYDEVYEANLPNAYARSILTVPWMEMGGKCVISCAKTGYSADIDFQCKPFYGGKKHQVVALLRCVSVCSCVCVWYVHIYKYMYLQIYLPYTSLY